MINQPPLNRIGGFDMDVFIPTEQRAALALAFSEFAAGGLAGHADDTGVIDAAEGPVGSAYAQKFHQAAKYVMRTDHLMSSQHITINDKVYQSLPEDVRKIMVDAAREAIAWGRKAAEAETEDVVRKMAAEGATVVTVNRAPFAEKAISAVNGMEKDGAWPTGAGDGHPADRGHSAVDPPAHGPACPARAGRDGWAVTLVEYNQHTQVTLLQRTMRMPITKSVEVFSNDPRLSNLIEFEND